jgi:hypothetical protein
MSDSETQRRIDGARLLSSFPEFIKQYHTGELNLTHASLLRRHFRTVARIQKEKLSRENRFELVQKLLGKSTREAERILVEVSSRPDLQYPTRLVEKLLINGSYRVQFEARPDLIAKSEPLKKIWSHSRSGATWPEIIERAFDLAIEKSDPYAKAERNHMRLQKKERQHSRLDKAHNCKKPNVGKGENYDVDPVTGEIQLRLPLPINETHHEISPQFAPTVAAAVVPTADLPKGSNERTHSMISIKQPVDTQPLHLPMSIRATQYRRHFVDPHKINPHTLGPLLVASAAIAPYPWLPRCAHEQYQA